MVPASRVAIDSSSLLIAFGPLLTFKAPAPKLIISDEFNLMVLKHCKLIATTSFSQARILKGHPLGWKGLLHNYCVSTANHCRFFLPNPCHFQGLSVCIGKYLFMSVLFHYKFQSDSACYKLLQGWIPLVGLLWTPPYLRPYRANF